MAEREPDFEPSGSTKRAKAIWTPSKAGPAPRRGENALKRSTQPLRNQILHGPQGGPST